MTWLPILVAVALAFAAIALAAVPLWRGVKGGGRLVLGAALALFLLGIGGGTYWMVGRPYLAMRGAEIRLAIDQQQRGADGRDPFRPEIHVKALLSAGRIWRPVTRTPSR